MPLTQKQVEKPYANACLNALGLSNLALAKRCGVSHSQIHMARKRTVGYQNAGRISSYVARALRLSPEEELELKAEIMGHPGNLPRAYLGNGAEAAKALGVGERAGQQVVSPELTIFRPSGLAALKRLEEMGAPEAVLESVRRRVAPPPRYPSGRVTVRAYGPEAGQRREAAMRALEHEKPRTADALGETTLTRSELARRAGVGRESVRKALYLRCGAEPARKIAEVLAEEAGLTEVEREAGERELREPPKRPGKTSEQKPHGGV